MQTASGKSGNSRGCHRQRLLGETRLRRRRRRRRRRQLQQLAAVAAATVAVVAVAVATSRKRDLLSGASRNAHNEALK